MKLTFETNAGLFVAYVNARGEILVYSSDLDTPVAVISPLWKRQPVLDLTAEGVATAVREWLEESIDRLEIECITARIKPPGRSK